jgi:hypothetical protein
VVAKPSLSAFDLPPVEVADAVVEVEVAVALRWIGLEAPHLLVCLHASEQSLFEPQAAMQFPCAMVQR